VLIKIVPVYAVEIICTNEVSRSPQVVCLTNLVFMERSPSGRVRESYPLRILFELFSWDKYLKYVTRRVTFGPNAQMTSFSKMTLK